MPRARAATRPDPSAPLRPCEAADCDRPGEYPAPRSRANLRDYRWFCLDHVREYNKAWDYYKGLGPAEIEAALRADAAWQRPTWPLGRLGGGRLRWARLDAEGLRDPLGVLSGAGEGRRRVPPANQPPPELRAALDLFDLSWPTDSAALKSRYKELAKQYHPDATGGDRAAEERLKDINRAYSLLRSRLARSEASAR
ncbi:MAG: J domain-containing protein [Rhodovarius sp.]|nr:J domain-containing protein [Rhodovarius sp.]MCX7932149.1 J domain-containing protein [Rhodovarius sp.]MDW8314659.1 J domain-containing protein [Rhodovarius sp.]